MIFPPSYSHSPPQANCFCDSELQVICIDQHDQALLVLCTPIKVVVHTHSHQANNRPTLTNILVLFLLWTAFTPPSNDCRCLLPTALL